MANAYDCHVISMIDEPGKYAQFLERNQATGLEFRRFDAVDGRRLTPQDSVRAGLVREAVVGYTPGAIGCAASHLALWKQAVATGENLLIFEDDVVCRHDLAARLGALLSELHDHDIVLLGYNTNAVLDVRICEDINFAGLFSNPAPLPEQLQSFARSSAPVAAMRLNNAFGTCAYLVSPSGAKKLIALFPMDNRTVFVPTNRITVGRDTFYCKTIDMLMNTLYRHINAYGVIPPLAIPLNDPVTSTTRRA